jgi:hypothetical protein
MNARRIILVLATLVVALLVMNSVTLFVLLRQRAEIEALRAHAGAEERAARMQVTPRSAAVSEAPLSATQSVSIVLGEVNQENGLRQMYDIKDGTTIPSIIDGVACRELAPPSRAGELAKIHFAVDPSFKQRIVRAWVEVEYFDAAPSGVMSMEYDGPKAYTPSKHRVRLKNASEWKTATFELTDAEFNGRENGGADFRIIATKPKVFVRRVTLKSE